MIRFDEKHIERQIQVHQGNIASGRSESIFPCKTLEGKQRMQRVSKQVSKENILKGREQTFLTRTKMDG
ncbi:MAG: hypothetical protein WCW17_00505 [Patescibacteria group bacterium]